MMRWSQPGWREPILALVIVAVMGGPVAAETGRGASSWHDDSRHVVRRGQTLRSIAEAHGVSIDDLAAANELNPEDDLSIGRTLVIPTSGLGRFHVVRTGETVAQIARGAGCSVEELLRANDLGPAPRLRPGQTLTLPSVASETADRDTAVDGPGGRVHVVKQGESLNEIAHAYGVGTKVLLRANKIRNPQGLSPGAKLIIPDPRAAALLHGGERVSPLRQALRISGQRQGQAVVHYVMDGQAWADLARAYEVSVPVLQKANPSLGRKLAVGEEVRVPGKRSPVAVRVANCGYPGIRFVNRGEAKTIRLMSCKGVPSSKGRRQLSQFSSGREQATKFSLHPDLLKRLQRVADEYPGRVFHVVSGYRPPRSGSEESRHNVGRAFDFSVEGVPNRVLFEFCKTLPSTGCGLYPNSSFVHLDYRETSATWVDYAGPGESPDYLPRSRPEAEPADPAHVEPDAPQ
jgi:LysM repeat protein